MYVHWGDGGAYLSPAAADDEDEQRDDDDEREEGNEQLVDVDRHRRPLAVIVRVLVAIAKSVEPRHASCCCCATHTPMTSEQLNDVTIMQCFKSERQ